MSLLELEFSALLFYFDMTDFLLLIFAKQVTASEPVISVKRMVARELDVPVHLQRLVFKGKTLAGK